MKHLNGDCVARAAAAAAEGLVRVGGDERPCEQFFALRFKVWRHRSACEIFSLVQCQLVMS